MNSTGVVNFRDLGDMKKTSVLSPDDPKGGEIMDEVDNDAFGTNGSSAHMRKTSVPFSIGASSPFCKRYSRNDRQSIALAADAFLAKPFEA